MSFIPNDLNFYCEENCKVKKVPADAHDVNKIVERILRTGQMPPMTHQHVYADVSNYGDFKQSLDIIRKCQQADLPPVEKVLPKPEGDKPEKVEEVKKEVVSNA